MRAYKCDDCGSAVGSTYHEGNDVVADMSCRTHLFKIRIRAEQAFLRGGNGDDDFRLCIKCFNKKIVEFLYGKVYNFTADDILKLIAAKRLDGKNRKGKPRKKIPKKIV